MKSDTSGNKKVIITLIFLLMINTFTVSDVTAKQLYPQEFETPEIEAETAVLMEFESGKVLYDQEMHRQMHPASTTKIMTALLLIENASLREQVVVSENAFGTDGSSMYLNLDEKITTRDLLYGLMVRSANDAAVAIAEYVAGSVENFADMMNSRAKELGAKNTNFKNPHGLTEENHKTTAYDLGVIAREALKNPKFRSVASTRRITLDWPEEEDEDRLLVNRNELLADYPGALGVKTGYTRSANQTFVAAAERDGMTLIAVVLSTSRNRLFEDAKELLDFGFEAFEQVEIFEQNDVITSTEVENSNQELELIVEESLSLPIPKMATEIEQRVDLEEQLLKAPIEEGEQVGSLDLLLEEEEIVSVPLYTKEDVEKAPRYGFWILAVMITIPAIFLIYKRYYELKSRKKFQEKLKNRY
ncbi:D-alanyl-D-alanine carboxypeptidase family protein [Natranaerobius thermophilus]|uniref:serine-type D-Ala-D-Ala carboxypeptidase n=1 Tax=Natranaerobius thermophilus (strain ATCC BAA-1301 / DSM 18059 / JW/NM-WN-LF) TaxID=457570 RepID=B2A3M5_NATTJ|nr:D-alanyl-D-alanine carboxypeptidase family protein [Natranaerobius thermophilus]ACB83651.1 Serine-type D-Ala-D-Ala carboxypeptidase [Natranaerobius thermophilus JW/NM-WN-LF]